MYVAKQKINGKDYFYLRKSVREGRNVKSKHVAYLGKTRDEAEAKKLEILKKLEEEKISMDNEKVEGELIHKDISVEDLASFCKEKGFVYRSSDIYGGFAGFWDFGPLGIELFNNLKSDWWRFFVQRKDNVVGMEGSVISHPRTWKASGHIENFNDVFVKCKNCGKTGKLDENELGKVNCPDCGGEYESQGKFNLMFETGVGVGSKDDIQKAYLRGETAQGMFLDFKLISQTTRQQLPFGIAQIGRCFRNEIAPRDFLFRSREFHIGEFEFFINPDEKKCELLDKMHLDVEFSFLSEEGQKNNSDKLGCVKIRDLVDNGKIGEWHAYWLAEQIVWFRKLGLEEIKIREHTKEELSHYSSATFDVDYEYPFGSKEVAGNANRGQFDLTQHARESNEKMEVFDEKYKNKILPRVIEPTFGMERIFLALLTKAYCVDKKDNIVLKLPLSLAPVKAAIFPLIKREDFDSLAKDITSNLKKEFNVVYDKSGSIGRRYARNDEIGTPFCITIDEDSLKNKDVTIRFRDTKEQKRIKIRELRNILRDLVNEDVCFSEL